MVHDFVWFAKSANEVRTYVFAKDCRDFVKQLPKTASNQEYARQLIRSSGSQAAELYRGK